MGLATNTVDNTVRSPSTAVCRYWLNGCEANPSYADESRMMPIADSSFAFIEGIGRYSSGTIGNNS
jgi:hypothetical protein